MIFKLAAAYLGGILSGILIVEGFVILTGRNDGNFGGEFLIIPLIICLIVMGVFIGRTYPKQYKNKYRYRGRNLK